MPLYAVTIEDDNRRQPTGRVRSTAARVDRGADSPPRDMSRVRSVSQSGDAEPPAECLALVTGEHGHTEGWVVTVERGEGTPMLGDWRGPTTSVSGLFADPLARALREHGQEFHDYRLKSAV